MILHYFKKKENIEKKISKEMYKNILLKSSKILNNGNVFKEKNYNSSFELVSFILIIYINLNIKNNLNNFKIVNEELVKLFISDLDDSLRSKGIGDMSIGKYVKSYVKKFYFRLSKFPLNIDINNIYIFSDYLEYTRFTKNEDKGLESKFFLNLYKDILKSYNQLMLNY